MLNKRYPQRCKARDELRHTPTFATGASSKRVSDNFLRKGAVCKKDSVGKVRHWLNMVYGAEQISHTVKMLVNVNKPK